jgi:hypothetical protein
MKWYFFPIYADTKDETDRVHTSMKRSFPKIKDYEVVKRGEYRTTDGLDYWGVIVNKENRDVMNKNWGTNFDVTESLDKDKREKERKEKELAPLSIPSRRIRI